MLDFINHISTQNLQHHNCLKKKDLYVEKLGLSLDPRFVREEIFFNGLLRGLQTLNFNYDINDLENTLT